MQLLTVGKSYRARWGAFEVQVASDDRGWHGAVVEAASGAPVAAFQPQPTCRGLVALLAYALEQKGCQAYVDGVRRDLSDFLYFEPR